MPKSRQKTTTQRRRGKNAKRAVAIPPWRDPAAAPAMRAALREWYVAHHRKLPWRTAPTLYKTVVSEFMCQQTQIETVLPYFARWLEKFPDFTALASASEAEVLRAWEGLGYYRRARLLHSLARELVLRPEPPRTPEDWLSLPGVGPYTAAAITSITYGAPAAVVDGNVVRVLARVLGDSTQYKDGSTAAKFFAPAADALLDHSNPGDHNQAVMELGAKVCTRRNPLCTVCPLVAWCVAATRGEQEDIPRFVPKQTSQVAITRLWIERDGALLLHRRTGSSRRLAHLCELPNAEDLSSAKIETTPLAIKRRTIVNQLFIESIHRATLPARAPDPAASADSGFLWATPAQLARHTLSGPHRRWIGEIKAMHT